MPSLDHDHLNYQGIELDGGQRLARRAIRGPILDKAPQGMKLRHSRIVVLKYPTTQSSPLVVPIEGLHITFDLQPHTSENVLPLLLDPIDVQPVFFMQ